MPPTSLLAPQKLRLARVLFIPMPRIVPGRSSSTPILRVFMAFPFQTAEWARSPQMLSWLASCMQNPVEPPASQPPIPEDDIKLGHVYELVEVATDSAITNAMLNVVSHDAGVMLTCWLFHLGIVGRVDLLD